MCPVKPGTFVAVTEAFRKRIVVYFQLRNLSEKQNIKLNL